MSSDDDVLDNKFTGFGRRTNGTCDERETNCGPTTRGQSACCPRGMFCTGDDNTVCCPTDDDCTDVLLETPRCAIGAWQMYNNTAPFCCSQDAVAAFNTSQNSNICADSGFQPLDGDHTLDPIDQEDDRNEVTNTDTTSAPAPATPVGSSTTGAEGAEKSDSSNNIGAIVGGVVGGVLGLALILFLFWFLRRRQNKNKGTQPEQAGPPAFALSEKDSTPNPTVGRTEMDSTTGSPPPASELENPEQARLMGYYKTTSHQKPGERAELT